MEGDRADRDSSPCCGRFGDDMPPLSALDDGSPGPTTHSLSTKALAGNWEFFSPTELYWLFFPILPRCDCRLSAWASGRDGSWYPGLIAFSPIMANRRMAEARVGRSGSSLR